MRNIILRGLVFGVVILLQPWTATPRWSVAAEPAKDRWEKAIAAFEAADKVNPPPPNAVLFIGSSTIVRWKTLAEDFPDVKVINRGFGGSHIADAVAYAQRIVIPCRPRLIVLRSGSNDLAAGKTPEQVAADFRAFTAKVQAALPETRIAYMPIDPTPSRWSNRQREVQTNQLIRDFIASGKNLIYVETRDCTLGPDGKPREDLFVGDRLHFNEEGYKVLVAIVRPYLQGSATAPETLADKRAPAEGGSVAPGASPTSVVQHERVRRFQWRRREAAFKR